MTTGDDNVTPRKHSRHSKSHTVQDGDRKNSMHGPNKNVKHWGASWFYNKRMERKIKQERRERREKKHIEIVEDWRASSNVELGTDEIIRGMMEANTSWVAINRCTNYPPQEKVGRRLQSVGNA